MSPGKQSREAKRHPDDVAPRDVWSGLLRTQSTRQNGLGLYRISQDCFDDQRLRRCWTDRKQPVRIASGSQTVRSALGYVLVLDKAYTFACVCSRARTCGCASACPRGWCVRVKRIVVREGGVGRVGVSRVGGGLPGSIVYSACNRQTILGGAQRKPNRMLRALRQQLYELLSAAPNGMRLTNIPIRFEELFRFKLDPRAYGFPKLLNLLQFMSDMVLVEKKDDGHCMASLREHAEWVIAQANMEEVRAFTF